MRPRSSGYTSLDSLYADRESVSWYWAVVAFAAPWMILAGFMMLPATYDNEPQLRVGLAGISVFAVALMTAGYGMSGMLCFVCPSWIFQVESVFIPCLGASTLALFYIVYGFAISERYRWNTTAIVGIALASTTSVIYGLLSIFAYRKVRYVRQQARAIRPRPAESIHSSNTAFNVTPPQSASPNPPQDHPPVTYPSRMHAQSEEELTRQQMMTLLMKNENTSGTRALNHQNTFRIDLPNRVRTDFSQVSMPVPSQLYESQDRKGARRRSLDLEDLGDGVRSEDELRVRGGRPTTTRRQSKEEREERRVEIELGQR